MTQPEAAEGGSAPLTLEDAAVRSDGRVVGNPSLRITGVAPLEDAGPHELGFLASRRYRDRLAESRAGAFLVAEELEELLPPEASRIVVADAHRALRTLLLAFHPPEAHTADIHPTAVLGRGVTLGEGVSIGPYAVLGERVAVGPGSRIGAHCVLGRGSTVGAACRLHPHVVLYDGVVVGDRVEVHAGARLGVDGFGWTAVDGVPRKIPHVGGCVVEDDVEIGANTTLDRGSIGDTRVGAHAKLDNLVHLGHNVRLGGGSLLAAMVGIAGSTRLGRGILIGGQSGVGNHLEIGDGVQIAAASAVLKDVDAGEVVSGVPARPNREYLRKQAHVERLPRLLDRLRELEARVAALEPASGVQKPSASPREASAEQTD